MKKLFKLGMALLMAVLAVPATSAQEPQAQQGMPMPVFMPVDSAVRVGQLPNGLTYYIRHNETPKGQADFYIAQRVGSILEEDNQRGLAHFLEHMCFNGTENFPEKGIINWLESVGVKFGYNLNAYTSVDETVYNISSVPVARQSVQDSCLLILHDWSCALTLDPAEIDAERGVIHEEWRRSMVGQMRILENLLPKVYPNNKYGQRLPIGTMEVVDNFPPQAIIDYYHTWYRPDNQAIIVVGDIDVDYIEGKIKEMFTPIKMPENAKERYYVPVEDTPGTIYAIGSDPEMSASVALMMFKFDQMLPREYRNTDQYYGISYATDMISTMLSNRLSDIANRPDAPFAHASVDIDNFFLASTKDAVSLEVVAKDGDLTSALAAAYRELLRALRGGFTEGEYQRATAELRSQYQRLFDQRNNTPNESYSREYVRAFVDNEPIPGIAIEKQIMDMLSYQLPVQAINQLLAQLISNDNRVVIMLMPQGEGYTEPTEQQVAGALAAVDAEEITPYVDEMKSEPLIPSLPAPGSIVSERKLDEWDAIEYTLSNGLKVVVKPTTFKENDIRFEASARGGYAVLSDDVAASVQFLPYAMSNTSYGTYSAADLKKYLQGKQVTLNISVDKYDRGLSGATTIQDLPTLMELIYAAFTEYNITPEEFEATQNMFKGVLANQESTPDFAFQRLIYQTLYQAPAEQLISTKAIDAASRDVTVDIVKQMLANASDYGFYFAGNINLDVFKPLMEQYLATLPVNGVSVAYAPNAAYECVNGTDTRVESMTMTTPQTWAFIYLGGHENYTPRERAMASMTAQILSKRLLNKIREEMGATYSIGAGGVLRRLGDNNLFYQIPFPMKPEMREEVMKAIEEIINNMATDITDAELSPVKEYMAKEAVAAFDENEDWVGAMAGANLNGVNTFINAPEVINSITLADVMDFWKKVLALGNKQIILLNPAE